MESVDVGAGAWVAGEIGTEEECAGEDVEHCGAAVCGFGWVSGGSGALAQYGKYGGEAVALVCGWIGAVAVCGEECAVARIKLGPCGGRCVYRRADNRCRQDAVAGFRARCSSIGTGTSWVYIGMRSGGHGCSGIVPHSTEEFLWHFGGDYRADAGYAYYDSETVAPGFFDYAYMS